MLSTNQVLIAWVVLYSTTLSHAFARPGFKSGSCALSFISSMRAYDCIGLNWSEVPQNLPSSTDILDMSLNRIRELTNTSFKKIPNVKKLYLNDNMILTIESGTFDDLTNLDTLDLTMNALIEVPISIFHLPSLQRLLFAKNLRLDVMDLINRALPITAPLQYLDISYCPLLSQLPQFGLLMDLVHLNVTGNHVTNVSMANFVGICNLQYFTAENLTMEFSTACDCGRIDTWFLHVAVNSQPPFSSRCGFAKDNVIPGCQEDLKPSESEYLTHKMCRTEYQARESKRNIARICYIALGIIGGVILFVGVCYIYHRTQLLPEKKPIEKAEERCEKSASLLTPNNNDIEV